MTGRRGFDRRTLLKASALGAGVIAAGGVGSAYAATPLGLGGDDVLQLARVWVASAADRARLAGFDETHFRYADGSLELLLWPGDLAKLTGTGLRYELTADTAARELLAAQASGATAPAGSLPGLRTDYRTLADYEAELAALAQRYPDKARLVVLPQRSLSGRRVYGLEIARDVAAVDGRPVFYMDGLHHAREWPSGELTMMFGYDLLENDGTDSRVTAIVSNLRTLLVPVVNPDGFHHSRGGQELIPDIGAILGLEAYWRKNRRSLTGLLGPINSPDAYGVDNNRNYPMFWGGPGAGSLPAEQTYRGAAPASEPESANVRATLLARNPVGFITNHTFSNLILRPWGHSEADKVSPDEELLRNLGAAMAAHNGYQNIHSVDLYPATGTTEDWAYGALGSLGYTFEHGSDDQFFHPPYGRNIPGYYEKNRVPFLLAAEAAANAAHHGILRVRVTAGGSPVAAELRLQRTAKTPTWTGTFDDPLDVRTATGADGQLDWHVNPSQTPPAKERGTAQSYTLTVTAAGRQPVTRSVSVDRGQVVAVDVALS